MAVATGRYQRERRSMRRRARLVGRPEPGGRYTGGGRRSFRGGGGGGGCSYRSAASLPLPLRSASPATRTIRRPRGKVTCRRSPGRTTFEGLAASPLTSTLPPLQAHAASVRLLKKRAAHSHLSMRTSGIRFLP